MFSTAAENYLTDNILFFLLSVINMLLLNFRSSRKNSVPLATDKVSLNLTNCKYNIFFCTFLLERFQSNIQADYIRSISH